MLVIIQLLRLSVFDPGRRSGGGGGGAVEGEYIQWKSYDPGNCHFQSCSNAVSVRYLFRCFVWLRIDCNHKFVMHSQAHTNLWNYLSRGDLFE